MMMNAILCAAVLASAPTVYGTDTPTQIDAATLEALPMPVTGRAARPFTIAADIGWNSLGGTGLLLAYDLTPHFSIDAAGGFSGQGAKTGVRARYNLLSSNFTPFIGLGASYGFGFDNDVTIDTDGSEVSYHVAPSPSAQAVIGASWVTRGGFSMLASIGYTDLLRDGSNVIVTSGVPTERQSDIIKAVSGGGPVASLALGYAL